MNKDIIELIKKNIVYIILLIAIFGGAIYVIGIMDNAVIPVALKNYNAEKTLITEVANKKKELERILAENKAKNEASKKASVKEFYKTGDSNDVVTDLSPMFENIITLIKQNGLRMKTIKNNPSLEDDNLIKNGNGIYSGYNADFELVGYYTQFNDFLKDLDNYPYFINIAKFEIKPYQYDKRILIANVSIRFYSKR